MEKISYSDLSSEKLSALIKDNDSFQVIGLTGKMMKGVSLIESEIENQGMRCRIYTYGRIASAGATVFGGITGLLGLGSMVGIGAHNLATFHPDYEIAKHIIDNKLTVTYVK